MKKTIVAFVVAAACSFAADAFTQRRSFRGGYPVGTGGAGARVNRQAALSEKNTPLAGSRGTGRKKNIRLVKADGSFAMKVAKGDPVLEEVRQRLRRRRCGRGHGAAPCRLQRGAHVKACEKGRGGQRRAGGHDNHRPHDSVESKKRQR